MFILTGASPPETVRHALLLVGAVLLGVVLMKMLSLVLSSKTRAWHFSPAAATGVDAAEKGDTRQLLLGKVPYDLQKRAIMHKRWMMIGHESQWPTPGDYRTFTVAEVPFVVIRGGADGDGDGDKPPPLRAFHNVCRHRAYTVVRKARGRSTRLFCRYHGWAYDSAGRLARAPCFNFPSSPEDDVEGRTTTTTIGADAAAANGLFGVHTRVDAAGFVFVNFATDLADAFPWSDVSPSRLRALDFGAAQEWEVEVDLDWRVASLLPWFIDPMIGLSPLQRFFAYVSDVKSGGTRRLQYVDDASFLCGGGGGGGADDRYHLLVSALPTDGRRTTIKITAVPRQGEETPPPPSRDHHRRRGVRSRVDAEIAAAVDALGRHRTTSANLDFRQSAIRERLDKFDRHVYHHRAMEKAAGRKINVAARVTGRSEVDVQAEAICSALEGLGSEATSLCSSVGLGGELEW